MQVIHHGGKDTVTGSCHELVLDCGSVLVDCGQFQGHDAKLLEIDFPIEHIKALIVTHAHIDHIGRIPWLLAAGFKGPIYCSHATAELIPLMLDDGLSLQLAMGRSKRDQVLNVIRDLIKPVAYDVWHQVEGLDAPHYFRLNPAGHILGSAFIEFQLPNQEIVVFSGDLGPCDKPLLPDPISPSRADYLFLESTYGDKCHETVSERGHRLKAIIERSLQDGGTIIIPAFSVGRTQELLFDIEQLIHSLQLDAQIPIILDSPMANEVTRAYRKFKQLWATEAKERLDAHRHPLSFEQCVTIKDFRQHQRLVNRLASTGEMSIVIAASGMCQGGRVMAYLQSLLPDARTDVIFSGYQAEGTLGRELQMGAHEVEIDGQKVKVNANIHSMSGYSAHADQTDLVKFVTGIDNKPRQIHLIHGETESKSSLAQQLKDLGYQVVI
ncbi:metallo-beta-lactamase family protein [Vibrio xiamenensis]|uniref:Metallo-beta-lactamase family protein n=1 Tax=Vibrio xiamenensis TaxID=861298 RepID=A0A1G8EXI0_9VIBR|nr:MBL fold metallo-hydrolase [Vibrio xiamenensis]SDH74517.1 metallo-beta-lactamase family protein [Vibrio xiamenensis]